MGMTPSQLLRWCNAAAAVEGMVEPGSPRAEGEDVALTLRVAVSIVDSERLTVRLRVTPQGRVAAVDGDGALEYWCNHALNKEKARVSTTQLARRWVRVRDAVRLFGGEYSGIGGDAAGICVSAYLADPYDLARLLLAYTQCRAAAHVALCLP